MAKKKKTFAKKHFVAFLGVTVIASLLLSSGVFAQEQVARPQEENCYFETVEEPVFSAKMVSHRAKYKVEEGEAFRVKAFVKNNGNTPWFSGESKCVGPNVYLGTDKLRDRKSVFYDENLLRPDQNWLDYNRVYMDQLRVDPGEIASFTFWMRAPEKSEVYKEYFTPLVEGVDWLDEASFGFAVAVGEEADKEDFSVLKKKIVYTSFSDVVSKLNLDGERAAIVDLSEQMLKLVLDGKEVRTFRVSTGAPKTPTPVGENKILLKQDVRVGSAPPHYVMPRFMLFKSSGYGLHALPSLRNDNGVFWSEAREHIGIPVSHGCIRMLPEDADFAYDFLGIGDKIIVQR